MEDARNLLMQPDNAEPSSPLGGLASQAMGGLSKFANNVNKGIEAVLSHPLYARAWSGMVSAQASDPMAGPMALQQLQQSELAQRYQKTQMQREEEAYTTEKQNAMLRAKQIRDMQRAMAANDPAGVRAALSGLAPTKAAEMFLAPPASAKPVQVMRDGRGVWATPQEAIGMPTVPKAPLVENNIGGTGMNPYQVSQTRAHYISEHQKESEPYVATTSRLAQLDKILADLGEGEPNPSQSEAAATAFAKGLKPTEAVMRDDIARILGQGFENVVKGFLNLPQKASRAQIQQMRDALQQIEGVARQRQMGIDEKYRALGSDYEVKIPSYSEQPKPPSDAPPGSKPVPGLNGIWEAPNGDWYRSDG